MSIFHLCFHPACVLPTRKAGLINTSKLIHSPSSKFILRTNEWKNLNNVRNSQTNVMDSSNILSSLDFDEWNEEDECDLSGYMDRVKECNFGLERKDEFLPFIIENQLVGYIHQSFWPNLAPYSDVFVHSNLNSIQIDGELKQKIPAISLADHLRSSDDRTLAVSSVLSFLNEQNLIPGWRNEKINVTNSFGSPPFFFIERAAAPFFGIKQYGVHVNGYFEKNGKKYLWVAKRSANKQTYPNKLDHLVAGGQPKGLSCMENVMKECEEEAGISFESSKTAYNVGAISYSNILNNNFKRDVIFCYDLKLPSDFIPINQDGEVESFFALPISKIQKIVKTTTLYKPNCSIVIIDFLIRHGYVTSDHNGYLSLLDSLKQGELS